MERKNGNEDQSESSSPSSYRGMKESKIRPKFLCPEPCEICGSVGIESLMMTCFKCRETREHTYCARVFLPSVPPIWLCEVCRSSSSCVLLTVDVPEDLMDSETTDCASQPNNFGEKDHETAKLTGNGVEDVVDTKISSPVLHQLSTSYENASSVIRPPSQPHTSPLAKEASLVCTSQDKEQHSPSQAFLKDPNKIRLIGKTVSLTPQSDLNP